MIAKENTPTGMATDEREGNSNSVSDPNMNGHNVSRPDWDGDDWEDDDEPPFDADADPWMVIRQYSPHSTQAIESVRAHWDSVDGDVLGLSPDALPVIGCREVPLEVTVLLDADHPIMACRARIEQKALVNARVADAEAHARAAQKVADERAEKIAAEVAAEAVTATSSWDPVDLTEILADRFVAPVPSIMARADGLCLMYPGLVHSFHGESESGKSLIMQHAAAVELGQGRDVLYLDYESDVASVVGRLRELGAPVDMIARHFHYLHPEESFTSLTSRMRWARLLEVTYSLAIIDGVTDALATFGYSSIDNDDVTKWQIAMPRKIASETGAAVALIDHVSKDNAGRGRFAVGGSAKMNGLTGAAYIVEVGTPLGRGRRGVVNVRIGKDRPGGVRGQLIASDKMRADRTEAVATVVVDSTSGAGIHVELQVPTELAPGGVKANDAATLDRAAAYVTDHPGMSKTATAQAMTGKYAANLAALATLITQGYVEDGGRGKGLRTVNPYVAADDVFAMHTQLDRQSNT